MRKVELAANVATRIDLSKDQAQKIVNVICDEIGQALQRAENVNLVGFGTFEKRHRGARSGKNPQTGEDMPIRASNTVGFKPGKALREAVTKEMVELEEA